jgi:ketosteroid isomerase-like protein
VSAAENEAVVRGLYEAMAAGGDLETFLPFYAEDVLIHAPRGEAIVMGERRGRESMKEAMAYIGERVTSFQVDLLKLFADDEEVVSVHRDRATRADGRTLDLRVCARWIVRDGQIAELWEYPEEPADVDAFFI